MHESQLFAAVLHQALEDLLFPRSDVPSQTDMIRADALSFLTATHGSQRWDRECICDAAGVCPDALRQRVIAILEGAPFKRAHWRGAGKVKEDLAERNLETARALWRKGTAPPRPPTPPEIDEQDAIDRILALMTEPRSVTEIATRSGLPRALVRTLSTRLVAQGLLDQITANTVARPGYPPETEAEFDARMVRMVEDLEARRAAA